MTQPVRVIQYSFSYGEISPNLEFRGDVEGYVQAAQRIENFIVDYRGGLYFRPGTIFVDLMRFHVAKLEPFRLFGDEDKSFLLVFTPGAVEFVINKAFQLGPQVSTSGTFGDYAVLDGVQDIQANDILYLDGKPFRVAHVYTQGGSTYVKLVDKLGSVVSVPAGSVLQLRYILRTPWFGDNVKDIQLIRNKNEAIIFHKSSMPKVLRFNADGTWTLEDADFGGFRAFVRITQLTAVDTLLRSSSPSFDHEAWYVYRVAAVDANGNESPAGVPVAIRRTAMSQVAGRTIRIKWNPVPGAVEYIVYRTREVATVSGGEVPPFGQEYGFIGRTSATHFVDENITPDFTKVPRTPGNPVARRSVESIFVSSSGSGYINKADAIIEAPSVEALGADGVWKLVGFGVVNTAGGIDNVEVIDLPEFLADPPSVRVISQSGGNGASFTVTLTPDTGVFPRTGLFYNQRLLFAGADSSPQTVYGSVVGEPFSFDSSIPPLDSDSFAHSIVMGTYDPIIEMKEMNGSVVIGTPAGIWSMSGGGPQNILGPASVDVSSQTFTGISNLGFLKVESGLCFLSPHNRVLYSLTYNPVSDAYSIDELSLFASHILFHASATSWVFNQRPFSNILVTRTDGQMASFTYFPEQKIFAWTRLKTDGRFECVGAVNLSSDTDIYVVTRRNDTPFLEVFASVSDNVETHHRLDCGYVRRGQIIEELIRWDGNFISTVHALNYGDVVSLPDGGAGEVVDPSSGEVHWFYPPSMKSGEAELFELFKPTAMISGIDLYAGTEVDAVLDGEVLKLKIESDGSVVLPKSARMVFIGRRYPGEVETLPVDLVEHSVRTSFRRHVRLSVRLSDRSSTKGFRVGPTRDRMTELHFVEGGLISEVVPLEWSRTGTVNLFYEGGLQTTILGFVMDVVFGS